MPKAFAENCLNFDKNCQDPAHSSKTELTNARAISLPIIIVQGFNPLLFNTQFINAIANGP
jgi:hypothetical protein